MFITARAKQFIFDTIGTLGDTLNTIHYRLTTVETEVLERHNEHEEEIRNLKLENQQLRSDLDQLCNVLSIGYRIESAKPATPERRIFVRSDHA